MDPPERTDLELVTTDQQSDPRFRAAAAGLPRLEVDPVALKLQQQLLIAKMFGGESEPPRLGRYVIQDELGRGGMGVVYKAHDPELDRHVAIKLITKDDPQIRDRFRREGQAIAKVKHPNVIDVYDTHVDNDGRPFIVMEYVEGQNLKEWIEASPRDIYEIFKTFALAGRGLGVIHDQGIVHHDFKPENVLIGKDRRARVADFGLARASDEMLAILDSQRHCDAFKHDITQPGALLGTFPYMAPELFIRDGARGNTRTDQFAFCVSLYEALAGSRPFQGKNFLEIREAILRCEVKALPRAKKIPRRVEAAIRKGLSALPEDRHGSMKELTNLLTRVSKRPKRHRWFTWAAAVLTMVLAIVGAYVSVKAILDSSAAVAGFGPAQGIRGHDAWTWGFTRVLEPLKRAVAAVLWAQCEAGNTESCYNLAIVVNRGKAGAPADKDKATALFHKACEADNMASCFELSFRLDWKAETERVISLLQKSCDGGDALACRVLGDEFLYGNRLGKDTSRGEQLLTRACSMAETLACGRLAWFLWIGRKQVEQALEVVENSCTLGNSDSCTIVGGWLSKCEDGRPPGFVPDDGKTCETFPTPDANKATLAFERSCRAGSSGACHVAADRNLRGKGVTTNMKTALELLELGCPKGRLACGRLGQLYEDGDGVKQDLGKALDTYEKGCDANETGDCYNAARVAEKLGRDRDDGFQNTRLGSVARFAHDEPKPDEPEPPLSKSEEPRPKRPEIVEVELHAGDFDTTSFDFGSEGNRTISTAETTELPAKKIKVRCREYDASNPRDWMEQTLDLGTGKRTIKCLKGIGPRLQ